MENIGIRNRITSDMVSVYQTLLKEQLTRKLTADEAGQLNQIRTIMDDYERMTNDSRRTDSLIRNNHTIEEKHLVTA